MGGIIGLTVRFSKTEEYRGSCWTNTLPVGLFAAPFYLSLESSKAHTAAWLCELLANRKANPEIEKLWGGHDKLAPIEYGLVVVDYQTSALVSCQKYSSPDYIYNPGGYDEAKAAQWDALDQAGLLTKPARRSQGTRQPQGWQTADVTLPFAFTLIGDVTECDATLQAWCESNFGLSDEERAAWALWLEERS